MLTRFTRWLAGVPATDTKASRAQRAVAISVTGRPVWTPRDYAALSREGFQKNAVVHRSVRLVAEAAASLPLTLMRDGAALGAHPLLISCAAPIRARADSAFSRACSGISWCRATPMWRRCSSRGSRASFMRCAPTGCAWCPASTAGRRPTIMRSAPRACASRKPANGVPPILHLTLFHPADDHYGLSPMEAAAIALDIHNAAGAWNKALLDNAARPSGALVVAGGMLTEAQFERLKARTRGEIPGRRQCRPPAASRRRARLEAAVALAEGHGFRRRQSRRRTRDRARLRRAAAAARAAGRQHACELRGGEPRLLSPDRRSRSSSAAPRRWRIGCRRPSAKA